MRRTSSDSTTAAAAPPPVAAADRRQPVQARPAARLQRRCAAPTRARGSATGAAGCSTGSCGRAAPAAARQHRRATPAPAAHSAAAAARTTGAARAAPASARRHPARRARPARRAAPRQRRHGRRGAAAAGGAGRRGRRGPARRHDRHRRHRDDALERARDLCRRATTGRWARWTEITTATRPSPSTTPRPQQKWEGFGGAFNELGWNVPDLAGHADAGAHPALQRHGRRQLRVGTHPHGRQRLRREPLHLRRQRRADPAATSSETNRPAADTSLSKFSLARDMMKLIPYIKAAQGVKPDLRFWASPWTPPVWMKTGYKKDSGGTGGGNAKKPSYYDGGTMKNDATNLTAYAELLHEVRQRLQGQGHQHRDRLSPERARLRPELPVVPVGHGDLQDLHRRLPRPGHAGLLGVKVMLGTLSNAGDANRNDFNIATAAAGRRARRRASSAVVGAQWGMLDKVIGGQTFSGLPDLGHRAQVRQLPVESHGLRR